MLFSIYIMYWIWYFQVHEVFKTNAFICHIMVVKIFSDQFGSILLIQFLLAPSY